jgi:hypothetical protein
MITQFGYVLGITCYGIARKHMEPCGFFTSDKQGREQTPHRPPPPPQMIPPGAPPRPSYQQAANKARGSYAAAAAAPSPTPTAAPTPGPPTATTATTTAPVAPRIDVPYGNSDRFWVQLVFPCVDDGVVTAEAVKAELKANKVTGDLIPHASQFQFVNRSVLSAQFPGGWYVSFRVPKGRSPEDIRARNAFHWIREHGLQIFGFTVKPKRSRKATPTTFCTSCCGYGHNSWRCINRPLRCSLCAGAHSWAQHKCTFSGLPGPTWQFMSQTREA